MLVWLVQTAFVVVEVNGAVRRMNRMNIIGGH